MTRREKLQEALEEAMFALLMDYVAEAEGKKALEENRALQNDPTAEVPQEVRQACLNEIHHAFQAKAARSTGRIAKEEAVVPAPSAETFVRKHADLFAGTDVLAGEPQKQKMNTRRFPFGRVLAAAALIAAVIVTAACATQRNPFQAVADWGELLVRSIVWGPSGDLTATSGNSEYPTLEDALAAVGAEDVQKITWIPSRFQLSTVTVQTNMATGQDDFELWAFYESEDGSLVYNILNIENNNYKYAIEKIPGCTTLALNGMEYYVVDNNGNAQIEWAKDGYSYTLAGDLSEKEIEYTIQSLR